MYYEWSLVVWIEIVDDYLYFYDNQHTIVGMVSFSWAIHTRQCEFRIVPAVLVNNGGVIFMNDPCHGAHGWYVTSPSDGNIQVVNNINGKIPTIDNSYFWSLNFGTVNEIITRGRAQQR